MRVKYPRYLITQAPWVSAAGVYRLITGLLRFLVPLLIVLAVSPPFEQVSLVKPDAAFQYTYSEWLSGPATDLVLLDNRHEVQYNNDTLITILPLSDGESINIIELTTTWQNDAVDYELTVQASTPNSIEGGCVSLIVEVGLRPNGTLLATVTSQQWRTTLESSFTTKVSFLPIESFVTSTRPMISIGLDFLLRFTILFLIVAALLSGLDFQLMQLGALGIPIDNKKTHHAE